jgi:hypothetical protein
MVDDLRQGTFSLDRVGSDNLAARSASRLGMQAFAAFEKAFELGAQYLHRQGPLAVSP